MYDLVQLRAHERFPVTGDLGRVGTQDIATDAHEYRVAHTGTAPKVSQDFGNRNTGPNRGTVVVDTDIAHLPDDSDDIFNIRLREAGLGQGDLNFGSAVIMVQLNRDEPVQERILGFVDTGIFFRVRGKNCSKTGMHINITHSGSAQPGQIENLFFQNAEQGVVGFRPGTGKLVINQRISILTGRSEPVIFPHGIVMFLGFQNRMNVVVDKFVLAIP